jgi:phage antirepressor YoqD-like protein
MYTIHNAARVLGVSERTVRNWIAQDNIEIEMIETDRKRIYLGYDAVLALADKHRPLQVDATGQEKNYQDLTGLYSIADAAKILDVKHNTARSWIEKPNIEKKVIITDKKRAYISYTGLLALAEKHNRKIAYDKVAQEQNSNTQEDSLSQDDGLYTVADAALFLGVTEDTVREWLSRHNIERLSIENDKKRIYIMQRHAYVSK